MTLEQLRIFVAVAEREHVTRAAHDLNLTQSATSAAVAALEARHATRLFDRVGRRIVLTDTGRMFLAEAKAVLARAEAAELVLADLAGLKVGSLSVAASQTVGNYWLPNLLHRFRTAYPSLTVSMTMGNTQTVATGVREGEANIGFVEGDVTDPLLQVTAVADDEMVIMVPAGHPWAKHGARIDLAAQRWVLRERGSGTRAILEGMLDEAGIDRAALDVALVLPTNEAVRTAVEAGAGVTVLSRLVARNALHAGVLVAVDHPVPRRQFLMLRHKERYVTAAEREFVRMVEAQSTLAS
jgi:DNA-binding transcriptional LysR family regulator